MSAKETTKSFEELRSDRAAEWASKQSIAARMLDSLHAELLKMPDVRDAPSPDHPWSHPDIQCQGEACAGKEFRVTRWVTVNGVRHRAELKCLNCQRVETWDWTSMGWID